MLWTAVAAIFEAHLCSPKGLGILEPWSRIQRTLPRVSEPVSIRVYLIEDHQVMREALTDYLASMPGIEVCGVAATAEQAEEDLPTLRPSIVLLDLSLPGRSGLDFLEGMQSRSGLPFVVLSGHREQSHVQRAFAAGAKGYVLKGVPGDVPAAIRTVMDGNVFLSDSLRRSLTYEWSQRGT